MIDYYERLQDRMGPVVGAILENQFGDFAVDWSPVSVAAALHYYVSHKLPYETRHEGGTRPFRSPVETWQQGGNCEEKTVALTSLFDSLRSVDTRMVSVTNHRGDGHLLVELGVEEPRGRVESSLEEFYRQVAERFDDPATTVRRYYRTNEGGRTWYLADPEQSGYVGDGASLHRLGYLSGTSGQWQWHEVTYYVYPDAGRVTDPPG